MALGDDLAPDPTTPASILAKAGVVQPAAPQGGVGQKIADTLAGAFGAPIDRIGLNSQVQAGQTRNGLVSAQTAVALENAQKEQEEAKARAQIGPAIAQLTGNEDLGRVIGTHAMSGNLPHVKDTMAALNDFTKFKAQQTQLDPNQIGTPAQTAAYGMTENKNPAVAVAAPPTYQVLPGAPAPNVGQTPIGAAQTQDAQAQAQLRGAQAAAGGFNPHAGGQGGAPLDPQTAAFEGYKYYKSGKMPPMGMGAGPARAQLMSVAADLATREANGEDITNPAFEHALQNSQDFAGSQRAVSSFAGGPLGNQAQALNNAVGHLQLIEGLWNNLQRGDIQGINKLSAAWKKQTGQEAPTDIQTAAHVLGPELAKVLSNNGGAGTGEERQGFQELLGNLAQSPEQTTGAIGTLKGMLQRQGDDLAFRYHGATGRGDFAPRYLRGDVSNYLGMQPGAAPAASAPAAPAHAPAAPAAPAAAPGKVMSAADYLKMHGVQ
jgi:hypothetical protein